MTATIILILIGLGMIGMWTADMTRGRFTGNFFRWREGESLLWPHILAEILTGIGLVASGVMLLFDMHIAKQIGWLSVGALFYTAINSTGWVLAKPGRLAYGIPIWLSLVLGVVALVLM